MPQLNGIRLFGVKYPIQKFVGEKQDLWEKQFVSAEEKNQYFISKNYHLDSTRFFDSLYSFQNIYEMPFSYKKQNEIYYVCDYCNRNKQSYLIKQIF